MSAQAQFASAINNGQVQVATANPNRDGTGTVSGALFAVGTLGSRLDDLAIKAIGTTTAGMIRAFIHDGANFRLWREWAVSAIVPSATVPAFELILTNLGLVLKNGWSLRFSTEKAETFNIIATRCGDF